MTLKSIDKIMFQKKLTRFLKDLNSGHPKLKNNPQQLGKLALQYAENIAIAIALAEPDEMIVKLLNYQCDFGTAHFQLAAKLVDEVTLEIEGSLVTIAYQPIKKNLEFEVWQMMVWSAMILRSPQHLNSLLAATPALYGESFQNLRSPQQWEGQFLFHLAQEDIPAAQGILQQIIQYVWTRKKATKALPQLPIFELWNFLLAGKSLDENELDRGDHLLATALRSHYQYWRNETKHQQPLGWISYPLIHACSWAYDQEFEFWESDYLPSILVRGQARKEAVRMDPTLKKAFAIGDSELALEFFDFLQVIRPEEWQSLGKKLDILSDLLGSDDNYKSWVFQGSTLNEMSWSRWKEGLVSTTFVRWLFANPIIEILDLSNARGCFAYTNEMLDTNDIFNQLILVSDFLPYVSNLKLGMLDLDRSSSPQLAIVDRCLLQYANLEVLDLANLKLKTLSEIVEPLKKLRELDLGYNKFPQFPQSLCQAIKLELLDLAGNCSMTGAIPLEISNLQKLKTIHLCGTALTDIQHLDRLPTLEILTIHSPSARIQVFPTALPTLKEIALSPHELEGMLPALPKDQDLKLAIVRDSNINDRSERPEYPPVELKKLLQLKGLKSLHISDIQIADLELISHFEKLEFLCFQYNYEALDLEPIFSLNALQSLKISTNSHSRIPDRFDELPELQHVTLNGMLLDEIPETLVRHPQLVTFEIRELGGSRFSEDYNHYLKEHCLAYRNFREPIEAALAEIEAFPSDIACQ